MVNINYASKMQVKFFFILSIKKRKQRLQFNEDVVEFSFYNRVDEIIRIYHEYTLLSR